MIDGLRALRLDSRPSPLTFSFYLFTFSFSSLLSRPKWTKQYLYAPPSLLQCCTNLAKKLRHGAGEIAVTPAPAGNKKICLSGRFRSATVARIWRFLRPHGGFPPWQRPSPAGRSSHGPQGSNIPEMAQPHPGAARIETASCATSIASQQRRSRAGAGPLMPIRRWAFPPARNTTDGQKCTSAAPG